MLHYTALQLLLQVKFLLQQLQAKTKVINSITENLWAN